MTHQYLSQISQAVLDVLGGVRSVDEISDSDDVQAVELVVERHDKCAVVRTDSCEPIRRKERAPLVIIPEIKMSTPFLEDESDVGQVQWELGRVVITYPGILSGGLGSEGLDERYAIEGEGDIGQREGREDHQANA